MTVEETTPHGRLREVHDDREERIFGSRESGSGFKLKGRRVEKRGTGRGRGRKKRNSVEKKEAARLEMLRKAECFTTRKRSQKKKKKKKKKKVMKIIADARRRTRGAI